MRIHLSIIVASIVLQGCADIADTKTNEKVSTNETKINAISPDSLQGNTSGITTLDTDLKQPIVAANSSSLLQPLTMHYLHLKNALSNDNKNDASLAATKLGLAIKAMRNENLTVGQAKTLKELKGSIAENAEHIAKAPIDHQREHFELLSEEMYEIIKVFGTSQILYKDHCPMYNDGKGAYWISERKEIQNPYLGTEMTECGKLVETIPISK